MAKAFQENAFQPHAFDEGTPASIGDPLKVGSRFYGDSRFGPEDTQQRDDKPNQNEGSRFGR